MVPVRILVADDHEGVRRGLRSILESQSGWVICGEATTGREAVQKTKELKPDMAILGIGMPALNGLEAARQIRKTAPRTEVLILTVHESEEMLREALDAGARGYVLKSDAARDLVKAVESLRHHEPFFSIKASELIVREFLERHHEPPRDPSAALTSRERQVVQLPAEVKSNKSAAVEPRDQCQDR